MNLSKPYTFDLVIKTQFTVFADNFQAAQDWLENMRDNERDYITIDIEGDNINYIVLSEIIPIDERDHAED